MSVKGVLHRVVALKTQTVELLLVSMVATLESESKKQTP